MTEATWFIIQTNPQCESKAAAELRRAGVRVYLPKLSYEARNRRKGTVTVRFRPLLVGYLFIRFPGPEDWFTVRRCQGVKGALYLDGRPGQIPAKVIASFMRRQRRREFGRPAFETAGQRRERLKKSYRTGAKVRVVSGAFEGFLATIEGMRGDASVDAFVTVFGRASLVNFSAPDETLRPVGRNRAA